MEKIRCFVAVEISEEQRNKVLEFGSALRETATDIKYVEPANLHLTLKFLGDVDSKDLDKIKGECEKALQGKTSFNMNLKGCGVFPNLNYVKIVWVGVQEGGEQLKNLRASLDQEISIGVKDKKPFSPHMTIGRVKSARNKEQIIEKVKEFAQTDFGTCMVTEIKVKKSVLTPEGPVYSDLFVCKLE